MVYGNAVPTVIPPTGVKTTLSYAATPPEVCTVTAGDGALSLVEVGECVITVTAAVTADYNEADATFTVNVQPAGSLVLNVPAVAGDDVVNIAEKAAGFALAGDTGAEDGATVSVSLGSGSLSATSGVGGTWSVNVPAAAVYLAEPSVALTVSARKIGLTAPSDLERTVRVDLTAPSVSYTAPGTLQVGVALAPMSPATTDPDLASYAAVGLPAGARDQPGGVISGTPTTAASAAVTVTVTATDTAGNATEVPIALPVVLKGDQPLSGFAYSAASGVFGQPPPTVTPPTGAVTALVYAAVPEGVCGVESGTGALSMLEVGACVITATAVDTADYNEETATFTVTVLSAGTLVVNVSPVTADGVVNIAEKASGFTISGDTGSQGWGDGDGDREPRQRELERDLRRGRDVVGGRARWGGLRHRAKRDADGEHAQGRLHVVGGPHADGDDGSDGAGGGVRGAVVDEGGGNHHADASGGPEQ